MINSKQILSGLTAALLIGLTLAGCSSVEKADIPSTANPQSEITKFDELLNEASTRNIDVLAASDFKSAQKMFEEAKSDLASGQKQEEILDDVRTGRGHLNQAYKTAAPRAGFAPGLLEARQMALKAGASKRPELSSDLRSLDSDLSDEANDFEKATPDAISKLEQSYVDLERKAVISTQLGNSQAYLNGAKKDGALNKAPNTYKKSEIALKTAETIISTNVRNPSGYQKAVTEANNASALLNDVMVTINQNKNLSEPAAIKMVSQNRQIKTLRTDLSDSTSANEASESAMQEKNDELSTSLENSQESLNTAQASVEIQRSLEKARSQFSSDEAEAYQQGGKLLIRMKKMNFASGRSDLPAASLASLAKVSEVAKSLHASAIQVEGHTDSTGTEIQNKQISEMRASAVAAYFKSNGFDKIDVQSAGLGFQKPIATNKSKEGRALNRRVDIVITPMNSTEVQ